MKKNTKSGTGTRSWAKTLTDAASQHGEVQHLILLGTHTYRGVRRELHRKEKVQEKDVIWCGLLGFGIGLTTFVG
jgi:hypothetical protein